MRSVLVEVLLLVIGLSFFQWATAIPVDNGVEGEPEIECGGTSITINFNTQNNFEGHVFVKGLYNQEGCRNDEGGRQVAGITLPFDSCNVVRTRSLNPRGIFVSTTVVISFHPSFVTKIDRAYRIQCFYMEADKTVSTQLEVSELTTAFQSQTVPMPICRYEILDGGPEGAPISFAEIGQQVYHKWTCDTETTETFCMVVHSCVVDDGNGDQVNILNADGCALDRYILNNLEYPADLTAGQEAHVYKYADRSQLFYQCQITITIKEPATECPRPQCSEPAGRGSGAGGGVNGTRPTTSGVTTHSTSSSSSTRRSPGTSRRNRPVTLSTLFNGSATPTSVSTLSTLSPRERRRQFVIRRRLRKRTADWERDSVGTLDVRTDLTALDISEETEVPASIQRRIHPVHKQFPDRQSHRGSAMAMGIEGEGEGEREGVCLSKNGFSLAIGLLCAMLAGCMFISTVALFRRPKKQTQHTV